MVSPGCTQREVHGGIGLRARMRLHVGVSRRRTAAWRDRWRAARRCRRTRSRRSSACPDSLPRTCWSAPSPAPPARAGWRSSRRRSARRDLPGGAVRRRIAWASSGSKPAMRMVLRNMMTRPCSLRMRPVIVPALPAGHRAAARARAGCDACPAMRLAAPARSRVHRPSQRGRLDQMPPRLLPRFIQPSNRMAQYIYTMNRRQQGGAARSAVILRDISLSFFPGAKIGVLGPERLGQIDAAARSWPASTPNIDGEARPQTGIKVGYLPQEPQLDPEQDVRAASRKASARPSGAVAALQRRSATASPSPMPTTR